MLGSLLYDAKDKGICNAILGVNNNDGLFHGISL